jgi:hypothetical protein
VEIIFSGDFIPKREQQNTYDVRGKVKISTVMMFRDVLLRTVHLKCTAVNVLPSEHAVHLSFRETLNNTAGANENTLYALIVYSLH